MMIFVPYLQRRLGHIHRMLCIHRTVASSSVSSLNNFEAAMKQLIDVKQYADALKLYHQQSHQLTTISSTLALKACTLSHRREEGIRIHRQLSQQALDDPFVQTSLIHFYMQCHDVDQAEKIFSTVERKTIEMHGALFKGYITNAMPEKVIRLFDQMSSKQHPTIVTMLFNACAKLNNNHAKQTGREILEQLPTSLFDDEKLVNTAIDMLMKFGDVSEAERLFHSMQNKTIVTYGIMVKGYSMNNMADKALDLFERIRLEPNHFLYANMYNACALLSNERAISVGKKLLHGMPQKYIDNIIVTTAAIDMSMKFGDVNEAERLFQLLKKKNLVTYGAMIKGYVMNDLPQKALDLLNSVPLELDAVLYGIGFNACTSLWNESAFRLGKKLLNQMPKKYFDDIVVSNAVVDMLMKFGDVTEAEQLFQSIKKPDIITYGAMIKGYMTNDLPTTALHLFDTITLELDEVLYRIVFDACASLSNERAVRLGKKLLNQMPKKYFDDDAVVSSVIRMLMKFGYSTEAENICSKVKLSAIVRYNAMIQGYNSTHQSYKALQILERIKQENLLLDEATSISLIKACSQVGLFSTCQRVINSIPPHICHSPRVTDSVIDMWGKAGVVHTAEKLFHSISAPTIYNHNSMINGYGRNGMGAEAIDLYRRIPENFRNPVTHACVLNACSHSGLIDQAQPIFNKIGRKDGYIISVMVDCYGRMFMFDEAKALIDQYEQSNPPRLVMYMALLSAARNHRRTDLAQKLYDRMRSLFPDEKSPLIAASILVSNTYSSVGDYEQSQAIRKDRIQNYGYKVRPGISWTEVHDELVEFRAHSHLYHPRSAEIQTEVHRMAQDLREHGHEYDSTWISRPLNDDESIESVLCGHSEKLAIAYNFIQKPSPSVIQVTKNLRVCGDCHAAIKLIAKIRQVEIIVRDANRIHHFYKNGQCSCQDHF